MQKRIMWVMESDLTIREIVAMFNEETNKIECYANKDDYEDGEPEWYHYYEYEQYFDTEGQAIDARNQFIREMKDMMPRVKKFVERMDKIDEGNEIFPHKKEDYLCNHAESDDRRYYRDNYWAEEKVTRDLLIAFHRRLLNINAETVRIDDVVRIEWGSYKDVDKDGDPATIYTATLVLKDGKKVRSRSSHEYRMVKYIFGDNNSNRVYNVSKLTD